MVEVEHQLAQTDTERHAMDKLTGSAGIIGGNIIIEGLCVRQRGQLQREQLGRASLQRLREQLHGNKSYSFTPTTRARLL
ncbi:hypothetical protein EYF80_012856 [Liparis tanakae]|uniref:Uncharacterized protein n=1 Tax=Liparis tanakae TaxID=230148 RepID=A0A4Z2IGE0_9TELE|nr:hypothetical protein EYF80_012856 [Liparis tanakae]